MEGSNLDLVGSIAVGWNNATFMPWSLHQYSISSAAIVSLVHMTKRNSMAYCITSSLDFDKGVCVIQIE